MPCARALPWRRAANQNAPITHARGEQSAPLLAAVAVRQTVFPAALPVAVAAATANAMPSPFPRIVGGECSIFGIVFP